ncbi:MAG TPA: N-acetylmuramoyl-L-alanine amidase [Alphaproteobacteria bacterium]|nr:N-acetylmuramoyl-L-alanine amidase [Alphaproteobacteria bacterium]
MLVLHYTGMETAAAALDRLCDRRAEVSAHYLITEDGRVVRLVAEDMRAWHAGLAIWRGSSAVNARSIGIELVNPGHEFGYRDFPEPQMAALEELALGILRRHPIPALNVVGHSDVAPGRKTDPGEKFNWRRLAGNGVGFWPETTVAADGDAGELLAEIGYDTGNPAAAVDAFQRRYRPALINGVADTETTALMAAVAGLRP